MNIGDLFFALRADGARFTTEVQREAEKAGDKGGATLGSRLAGAATKTLKVGLAVFGAVTGFAAKGLAELDSIQQDFAANTGATAEEAKEAGKQILAMSGRNLQPMREIGDALTTVHTNLGLTGDAAANVTELFLKFGRVTKRDAAAEVASFDDILDAWGKTAADIPGIMDQLVASHQEYGGSIEENEAALAAMAPQLQALNMDLDDGIGLLNLFASSGLDAATGQKALNSAIKNLPAGETLDQFIERLAKIEDPLLRAQEASKVFGQRAGPQLANAIKPGMKSLEDFEVHADDVAGAARRASDAVDSSFGAQVQLKLKQFAASVLEAGQNFGPVLTGLASLTSLAASLGLDTLLAKLGKPLATKMLQAGKDAGAALIDGAATAVGAAGTVIGNFIASRIEIIMDPDKNSLLGRVIRRGAMAAGALWGIVFGVATKVAEVLAGVFVKLPGVAALRGAVLAGAIQLGTLQGTAMGGAASLAFRGGFLLGLAAMAPELSKAAGKLGSDLGQQIPFLLKERMAAGEWLKSLSWPFGPVGAPDWAKLSSDTEAGAESVANAASTGMADLSNFPGKVKDDLGVGLPLAIDSSFDAAQQATIRGLMDLGLTLEEAKALVGPAAKEGIVDPTVAALDKLPAAAAAAVKPTPRAVADSLREGQFHVKDAVTAIKDAVKNTLSKTKEIAQIEGFLAGGELAKALRSKKPEVRAEAEAWKVAAEERLQALKNDVPNLAQKTGQTYADALASKQASIDTAARTALAQARARLTGMKADAADWGAATGAAYAKGIAGGIAHNSYLVSTKVALIARMLEAGSPPKYRENPLYGIDRWGYATGAELPLNMAKAITALASRVRGAVAGLATAAMPGTFALGSPLAGLQPPDAAAWGLARAAAATAGQAAGVPAQPAAGGGTYQTTIVMQERKRDELEVLERASWYQREGLINPQRRPAPAGA